MQDSPTEMKEIIALLPEEEEQPFTLAPKRLLDLRIDRVIERGDA